MNRESLINIIADKTDYTKKSVKDVLLALQEVVYQYLPSEEIKIMEGVTLTTVDVAERAARNPQTGEAIVVPAHRKAKCKFGAQIKALFA